MDITDITWEYVMDIYEPDMWWRSVKYINGDKL